MFRLRSRAPRCWWFPLMAGAAVPWLGSMQVPDTAGSARADAMPSGDPSPWPS